MHEWSDGKQKDIRALLCTLDQVLWEGQTRWKGCSMQDLVTADQVRKHFRKAVRTVHPDVVSPESSHVYNSVSEDWRRSCA